MKDKSKKVAIVGTGFVGMSYAYSLLNQGIADVLCLVDINHDRAVGEAMDLNHGVCFAPKKMTIYAGDYKDCKDADLVVITAGVPQKEGETRLDLLKKNAAVLKDVVKVILVVRSDTNSTMQLTYETDYESRKDLTPIRAYSYQLSPRNLSYRALSVVKYAQACIRRPGCFHIRHFTMTLENNVAYTDMSVVGAQIFYKYAGGDR